MYRAVAFGLLISSLSYGQNEAQYDSGQRISKIRDLGKRDAAAIPTLTQYLDDPDRDIRVETVKAIVKVDTEASLTPLLRALHDHDSEVQIRATDGLVNCYLPGYVARGGLSGSFTRGVRQVKAFFASRNDQVVNSGVVIRQDVASGLSDLVQSGSGSDVRANAARANGILLNHAAVPNLVQSLHARDNEVIFESLIALQKIKDPASGPGVSFLARDLDERTQITALQTIGLLKSLPSAPDVRAAWESARSVKVKRAALDTLATLGLGQDRALFQQFAADKDPQIRSAALEGLGRVREPEDTPVLQKSFDEADIDRRIHLAAAFGLVNEGVLDTGEFSPLAFLFEGLGAKDRSSIAVAYLSELVRREEVSNALVKLLPQASKDQKLGLCQVFAASRSKSGTDALKTLSQDIDGDVSFAATKALQTAQSRGSE